jgi:hypothetical protein
MFINDYPSKVDKEGPMEWIRLTLADNRRSNLASLC